MTTAPFSHPEQDRIDQEASSWVVLGSDRELTHEEQRAFGSWRAADPCHEETYQALRRTWADIPMLRDLAELAPLSPPLGDAVTSLGRGQGIGRTKRAGLAAFVLAAVATLALVIVPSASDRAPTGYATELAEMRQITLPDGSLVTLGPKSQLNVKFVDAERRVALVRGGAFFDVVKDNGRPFVVEAGASTIQVLGTKFDVKHGVGTVRVAVLEGLVEVADRAPEQNEATLRKLLRAGQQIEVVPASAPGKLNSPPEVMGEPMPAPAPGAWREGRLVYQNARLADVVFDVNRYYGPGVKLDGSAVGELRVTASFKTSEVPAFMSAVEGVVPVHVVENSDGAILLSMAQR